MLPLEGIKVVELAQNLAGPFCAEILSHLGAEVIKVEKPGIGDDARHWGKLLSADAGASFNAINLNKKSIVLDLKDPAERDKLLTVIDGADVVVQNMLPGVLEKMGLGAKDLMARNPRLIYCSVSAYGNAGPKKNEPGYEPIVQAFSAMCMMSGWPGGPPIRMGTQVLDHGSAMWAAIGVLSAIIERGRTGRGKLVETSLFETATAWWMNPYSNYAATGEVPERHPSGSNGVVIFSGFETADAPIVIAAGSDRLFHKLADVLGRPEWKVEPAYANNRGRVEHKEYLLGETQKILKTKPRAYWLKAITEAGVPCTAVNTLPEMLAEPQTQAMGMLQSVPNLGSDVKLIGLPIQLDGQRPKFRQRAPRLGEHNKDILG